MVVLMGACGALTLGALAGGDRRFEQLPLEASSPCERVITLRVASTMSRLVRAAAIASAGAPSAIIAPAQDPAACSYAASESSRSERQQGPLFAPRQP